MVPISSGSQVTARSLDSLWSALYWLPKPHPDVPMWIILQAIRPHLLPPLYLSLQLLTLPSTCFTWIHLSCYMQHMLNAVITAVSVRLLMKLKMMNDTLCRVRGRVAPLRQTIWSLSPSQFPPSSTQKRKHHWGCPPLRSDKMQSYKHTQTYLKARTPQFVAIHLQAFTSQWHIADHYSFETKSPTRPLNPWLLTYIILMLDNGHKTTCLHLLSMFLKFVVVVVLNNLIVLWIMAI